MTAYIKQGQILPFNENIRTAERLLSLAIIIGLISNFSVLLGVPIEKFELVRNWAFLVSMTLVFIASLYFSREFEKLKYITYLGSAIGLGIILYTATTNSVMESRWKGAVIEVLVIVVFTGMGIAGFLYNKPLANYLAGRSSRPLNWLFGVRPWIVKYQSFSERINRIGLYIVSSICVVAVVLVLVTLVV